MKRPFKLSLISLATMAAFLSTGTVQAGERESLEQLRATTVNLINLLVQEGVLSKDKADALLKQAAQDAARNAEKLADAGTDAGQEDDKVVRVQYVPEHVKKQMRDEIKQEVMAKAQSEGWAYPGSIPEWLNRIEWEGDLRLRYEKDAFPSGNATPVDLATLNGVDNVTNTSQDRDRWRVRARLGAKLHINDNFSGGIRLTTGSSGDPVSPNQTMGDSYTSSSKYSFALDRAYLKYTPTSWLTMSGGRIENPWFHTDLVWDPDLAFDGGAVTVKPKFTDNFTGFATVGAFPIQEVQTTNDFNASSNPSPVAAKDKWLYGAQMGFEWMSTNKSAFKLGLAYYDFSNIQGITNPTAVSHVTNLTARQFHQKGNTVFDINNPSVFGSELWALASKFREVNLTGSLDIASFNPVHVVLTGDYVKNIGFSESEVNALNPIGPVGGDTAWMAMLKVGMPDTYKSNDWNVFGAYKRLESNSVLDAYTDSDFHLGGTNAKGWLVGANYGLDKNTWLTARWFSADTIVGEKYSVDVLMLDLNAKF